MTTPTPQQLAPMLQRRVVERTDQIVSDLAALVALDAPSGDAEMLDANATLLERRVTEIGGRVQRHVTEAGTHLEAHFGPEGTRPVVVLAHYDTVWPRGTARSRPFSLTDGVIAGPGVSDMRGGLVAAVTAIEALDALGALTRPVVLLLTADEESGSVTSEDLIVRIGRDAGAVLVPEPPLPGGALKTKRKGVLTYRLSVTGRASHAGLEPERGVSAIHELFDVAQAGLALANPHEGTTVNVGVVGGGTHANVVAAEAWADIDVRVANAAEHRRVEAWFNSRVAMALRAKVTVELQHVRPPMERTQAIEAAAGRTKEFGRLLGLELTDGSAGGGSDSNFLAQYDVPIVDGLGPEGGGAHASDEHIILASLLDRVALIGLLVAHL